MTKVAILSALEDREVRQIFEKSLLQLNHEAKIALSIAPYPLGGRNVKQSFLDSVADADIVIPLISIDLLVEEEGFFLNLVNMVHNQISKKLIPILIRATPNWQNIVPFSTIMRLPNNQEPFVIKNDEDINVNEGVLTKIIADIRLLILGKKDATTNVQSVPKKITTLSANRKSFLIGGFMAAFFIPFFAFLPITPIYHYFNNQLFVLLPVILLPLILFLCVNSLDHPKIQNRIVGICVLAFVIYTLLFQAYCFKSYYHGGYLIKGFQMQEQVIENKHDELSDQNLIRRYGKQELVWKDIYPVEIIVLTLNIVTKILLGLSLYVMIQRLWWYLAYQKIAQPSV